MTVQSRNRVSIENNEDGFTITELLIAVAVGAIASLLIVITYVNTYGNVVVEQTKTSMIQQSQLFLRRMTDDIREGQEIRTNNQLTDSYNTGGWTTSDPANILITTESATDSSGDFIYDTDSGYPYQHEVIYFSNEDKMYRRLITNSAATGNDQIGTCPVGNSGCPFDAELVSNLDNLLFEFYDIDGLSTTVPEDARSVQVTVNLSKTVYGNEVNVTNIARMTLRNEN